MVGVLIGFAIIAFVIGIGFLVGRIGILGPTAPQVLGRLGFFVLSPPLLFTVISEADLGALVSTQLPIAAISAVTAGLAFVVISRLIAPRPVAETTIGALGSGYSNANNIGLPVSAYVLGDASSSVPIIMLQLLFLAPIALTVLDISTSGRASLGRILLQPVRNPLIIASFLGLVVALTGIEIPAPVLEPFHLIGAAAVPVILIAFGMSLNGTRVLAADSDRRSAVVATVLKLVFMPVVAWLVAHLVFGLEGHALFAAVILAALPAAQNVFNFAQRYGRGVLLGRDVVLLTTVLSLPALVVIAALLAPR